MRRISHAGQAIARVEAYSAQSVRFLAQRLSLRELTSVAGVGPTHFKMQFRQSMGVTEHQDVISARVENALDLLIHTALPISEVALQAGFYNQESPVAPPTTSARCKPRSPSSPSAIARGGNRAGPRTENGPSMSLFVEQAAHQCAEPRGSGGKCARCNFSLSRPKVPGVWHNPCQ